MPTTSVGVFKVATRGPGDVSGLMSMIGSGAIDPASILAILGKTEGNGGVNDFTREYAVAALCTALAPQLALSPQEVEQRIAFVMSGGTEGVLSPHITVFTRRDVQQRPAGISGKRLSIGMAHTRDFLPEELGRSAQITETADAVTAAMADAGIADPADVHFVQIKCPLLTSERAAAVLAALESVGLRAWQQMTTGREFVNVFAKAEASPDGSVRGFRHTMLEDTDISSTRHARAAVGGLIAGLAGTGAVYVSGGAEHQGPAGGGPVAAIARLSN